MLLCGECATANGDTVQTCANCGARLTSRFYVPDTATPEQVTARQSEILNQSPRPAPQPAPSAQTGATGGEATPRATVPSEGVPAVLETASRCPFCEGSVSSTASKCRHCGEWLRASGTRRASETSRAPAVFSNDPGFWEAIFDFSFDSFVTSTLIRSSYRLTIAFVAIAAAIFALLGFAQGFGVGLVAAIFAGLGFIFFATTARLAAESKILLGRIEEHLRAIRSEGRG